MLLQNIFGVVINKHSVAYIRNLYPAYTIHDVILFQTHTILGSSSAVYLCNLSWIVIQWRGRANYQFVYISAMFQLHYQSQLDYHRLLNICIATNFSNNTHVHKRLLRNNKFMKWLRNRAQCVEEFANIFKLIVKKKKKRSENRIPCVHTYVVIVAPYIHT